MPYHEFLNWKRRFNRDPFGITVDDQRHVNLCLLLKGFINTQVKTPAKIKIDELCQSKFNKAFDEIEFLLVSKEKAPWLSNNQTSQDLAAEGQHVFKTLFAKYGK
ncbi:MAG TPA: hypothetical protein EYN51_01185 [Flavobacteriales bacterium]|nr:hypothetical protein [Flavobacteriales bacterium]